MYGSPISFGGNIMKIFDRILTLLILLTLLCIILGVTDVVTDLDLWDSFNTLF